MSWKMGYRDAETNVSKGSKNEVLGVTAKDNVEKSRGKRANKFFYEEFGAFKKFIDIWNVNLSSVQEGNVVFGQAFAIGTGGSEGSDFSGALEIIYNPLGYNVYALPNYFDKNNQGKQRCVLFFGTYLNRKGLYNKDGVSDVVAALIEVFQGRLKIKYNSTDPMALTRNMAENPITIQEAIMRRDSNFYPVSDINDTINEIDANPNSLDYIGCGYLELKNGVVNFKPSIDNKPIREFPHKDNKLTGCIEVHKAPVRDSSGKVQRGRYIGGSDVYDDDASETLSLGSIYILDLMTDQIVCEFTGRPMFADDFYEIVRRMAIWYNAEINYENNKKGLFGYFSKMNCTYLLSDTLEFLKDKDLMKGGLYGNKVKGTSSTAPIKAYGRKFLRDWLLRPVEVQLPEGKEEDVQIIPRVKTLKTRALLKELALWNPDGNFDRHDAMLMLMLIREDKMIMFGEKTPQNVLASRDTKSYLGEDPFFKNNYHIS